ncbi:putative LPS assembly protein LptD [Hymenobacter cellulosivorans]|uniref:LPS-assembly protein LptD central domain-containing protein n=1 Tax=Hymenobacter cellulosivorans TaxID=2932249 RepID=A0ABY4F8V5_9BACT|nr:putative LPS assembly protein LptD [Hymenobacter cellulosivorans]UOQ52950.1 hypothetical protein MUN80_24835 [Hymenobacter cellulosivorans]
MAALWLHSSSTAWAQRRARVPAPAGVPGLSAPAGAGRPSAVGTDTTRTRRLLAATDTSRTADSLRVAARPKGDIETTIKYSAKDSIRFEVQNKVARLYNKSSIDYGDMDLQAQRITVDYSSNLLTAEGAADTTGKVVGRPVFKDGGGTYTAGRINYNFKTKRGKIAEAVTQQGEGYLHAETIKKNELNEIFGRNGRYTTCNLEHPHFFINATKMKVIPREKVVTGPFNMVIGDIPTPLGFLFGYFPTPGKSRASGLLFPTFGQTSDRGFALRNGGYYWVVNDNIGVRLTGDIYSGVGNSFGGYNLMAETQYLKRYSYTGLLNFSYSSRPPDIILPSTSVNTNLEYRRPRSARTLWVNWNHTPTPRPGGGRFSASVAAGSPDFNRQNSYDPRRYLAAAFNSTVQYSKTIRNSPVNYNVQLTQSQTTSGIMTFTLPNLSVGVARQYPYEWFGLAPQGRFYEQFSISYDLQARNELSNQVAARSLANGLPLLGGTNEGSVIPVRFSNLRPFLRNARNGMQHNFQISLGSYPVLKHIIVQPSVRYQQYWFGQRLRYSYNQAAQAVRIDTVRGFNVVSEQSAGVSMSTNIYGTLVRKGTHKIQAIRHKIAPSVSFSYSPDYTGRSSLNWVNPVELNALTNSQGQPYNVRDKQRGRILNPVSFSRYNNFIYSTPNSIRASVISFAVNNQVEMKVRNNNDTTGTTPFEKVSLIDGLDLGTTYNLAADSLNLAPLSMSFHTQIARKVSVIANASFEFYQRDSTGRAIDRFLLDQPNRRLARLAFADFSLNYQFNPAQGKKKSTVKRDVAPTNTLGSPNQINPYEEYVDFDIPWELTTSFAVRYVDPGPIPTRRFYVRPRPITSAALQVNGSVKLTPNFRFGYSTSYDFISKRPVAPNLDFYRDLHCWQISGYWAPFGEFRGYGVTISAKSSLLQDLKLNRNRSFWNR